jgi:hypothetical protein
MRRARRVETRTEVDVVDLDAPDQRAERDEKDHQHQDDEPDDREPMPLEAPPCLGPRRHALPWPCRCCPDERINGS